MAVTVIALAPTILLAIIGHRARVEHDIHAVPDERLAALETEAA
ncbi:hypothetical protein Q5424_08235 [Conexibacter sp. JD483]|nr:MULTISPECIES: hypothetical protein [unclassified Conexibacter]MDO8183974.1 hypothetical protein [Conexibacter sp. CPCC 205706]MDO8196966.1 hypothetical protein [Conexibacter sp. CPCC 205762]MDR9369064.1 hypothetical protein [Conexibacter sp. JD483]